MTKFYIMDNKKEPTFLAKFFALVAITGASYCVISLVNWNTNYLSWDNFTKLVWFSFIFWGSYHVLKKENNGSA